MGFNRRMSSTTVTRHIAAPRAAVYRALLDPGAIAAWRVPRGMSSEVHEFEGREGGVFRVSLTYDPPEQVGDLPEQAGKSSAHTDTYHGRFRRLVPDERVVEETEFETTDPRLQGTMTMTTILTDAPGGTTVTVVHEGVPAGVSPADNETGTRMALENLARLLERGN